MGQLKLLHISDIHYSSNEIYQTPSDLEELSEYVWSELSMEEKVNLSQILIRKIKKALYFHIEKEKFHSIIISGDLCNKGSLEEYSNCLDYLTLQFQNFSKKIRKMDVKIAAGNHDLISNLPYSSKNLKKRFLPFCNLHRKKGFQTYATDSIKCTIIEENACKVLLINVNSCLEFRNLKLLTPVQQKAIKLMISQLGDRADLNKLLNIPYISPQLIDSISKIIQSREDCFPIIFTHHNFLRIGGPFNPDREFDGIINEAEICQKLESLNRPILIFHGHIHNNREQELNRGKSKLILSSAPLLFPHISFYNDEKIGFNIVNIIFANNLNRTPLWCEIENHQIEGCNINILPKNMIRFYDSADAIQFLSENEKNLLMFINQIGADEHLDVIYQKIKGKGIVHIDFTFDELMASINLLFGLNLIKFRENKVNPNSSVVRGVY